MKTITSLTLILFLSFTQLFAQSSSEIIQAFKISYALEKSGSYKKAADELKKVYSNESYEINLRLGWLEYNAGLFDESASNYQKALNLKPFSEEAKFGLIYPKYAQGKWAEVISLYKKILKINPANTTANYRLGLIYFGKKDYTTAVNYFEKVVNLYPFGYDGLLMLAWSDYYLGKTKQAKVLFEKVLMNSPADKSATDGLKLLK
ncbi:MAG: tetratricopeptide repeat protein [Bacteroidales bacterium]|nr:tetratricopeptide repeat protein [Bacteroidales bacterium]